MNGNLVRPALRIKNEFSLILLVCQVGFLLFLDGVISKLARNALRDGRSG